jgi:cytoskeletal protein CcmA (bactofilin family)
MVANRSSISIIGTNTKLSGKVESKDVMIIAGQIEGDVYSKKVIIKKKGRVAGNIICDSLVIEPGGIFDGRASMSGQGSGENLEQDTTGQ